MLVLLFILAGVALWYAMAARSEARQARTAVTELRRDLAAVRSDLTALKTLARRGSISAAEGEGADAPIAAPPPPQPGPASATATSGAAARGAPPVGSIPATAPARQAARPLPPSRPPDPPPQWIAAINDWLSGGNLVAKLGLLILFIGIGFLLKYTAARVALPIELRLAGIVLADIALLAWGWRIRTARPAIGLPIQGTALAILMLVTFGAFRLYHLIPGSLAFALLFALTAFTCVLAVLQDAQWLAIFGIAGGFAAPILASSGGGSHIGLFSYYALLNCGVFGLAVLRSWRPLNLLGFAFTFAIGTTWGVLRYQPEHYLSAQLFLLLFFLFYVAIALSYARQQAIQLKHYVDGTLIFGTPMLAFGLQFSLVRGYEFGVACSALALGLFYVALATLLSRRRGKYGLLADTFLALGVVFGTLAIPFALDGRWTSAAWALEGAGIVWAGLRQKQRLAWRFGLLVQALAGLTLLELTARRWPLDAPQLDLFATPILGAAMILAGAMFSSWALMRQQNPGTDTGADTGTGTLSQVLLLWSGLWWFGAILPTLANWLAAHYQLLLGHGDYSPGSELLWSVYLLLVAVSNAPLLFLARRLKWPALRWSGVATWLALAGATLHMLGELYPGNHLPRTEAWLAYASLLLAAEALLRASPRNGWPIPTHGLKVLHTIRSAGPWLMIWPVAAIWIARWLDTGGDSAEAELLADAGWHASASWARFIPAWLMMAAIAWLMRRVRAGGWPVAPVADWYRNRLIPLACGWSLLLVAVWNLTQDGSMAPLPYVPLVNPLDLTSCFALLLALGCYRMLSGGGDGAFAMPPALSRTRLAMAVAIASYAWFNLALLRAVSHYLAVPYEFYDLFASQFVQAMLSLVWSVTALVLMRYAAQRAVQVTWIAGAALLGIVVAKLLLVDLSNVGGVERIISFLGVGALMVGIGYLAPYPAQHDDAPNAEMT